MQIEEVIRKSAALRGAYQFRAAIDLVKSAMPPQGSDLEMNAYHEMFQAAKEAGFKDEALQFAKKLLEIEPGLPSARAYVSQNAG